MSEVLTKDKKRSLPKGWRWAKLGEICDVIGGSTPKTANPDFWNGDIVWVTPTDLGKLSNGVINYSDRQITSVGLHGCGTELVPVGSVIMSSRAPIGHLAIAGVSLCTNQGCKSFVPKIGIDSVFLYWALKQSVSNIQALGSGATFTEVSKSSLQHFKIAVPSLLEQQRIAGILKEQMAAIDKARAATQARLETVKALPASFLRQVFPKQGQPLPTGWRWVKLREACYQDRNIVEPNSADSEALTYYSLEHIESGTGEILKEYSEQIENTGKSTTFRFDVHHVLYGKLRPYLNKVALPNNPGRCTTEMIPLMPHNIIDRVYLAWILRRQETVEFAMRDKTGSRMPRADMESLLTLEIPLPKISKQYEIIESLNNRILAVKKATEKIEAEVETINALPAALLRRAFNGEI